MTVGRPCNDTIYNVMIAHSDFEILVAVKKFCDTPQESSTQVS